MSFKLWNYFHHVRAQSPSIVPLGIHQTQTCTQTYMTTCVVCTYRHTHSHTDPLQHTHKVTSTSTSSPTSHVSVAQEILVDLISCSQKKGQNTVEVMDENTTLWYSTSYRNKVMKYLLPFVHKCLYDMYIVWQVGYREIVPGFWMKSGYQVH